MRTFLFYTTLLMVTLLLAGLSLVEEMVDYYYVLQLQQEIQNEDFQ